METVEICTGKPYQVHIGNGLLRDCGALIAKAVSPRKCAVVTDDNVAPLYLEPCLVSLRAAGFDPVSYVFPNGEGSKNLETISGMLEFFAESRLTRSDLAIALGGGVTGDMTGFAAGIYQRGIRYAQIPTTLLAAVDSSVGGKTAVNLRAGKNLAGVFLQPVTVVCDTDTLRTLPGPVFADGAAESIKYGVLCDPALLDAFRAGLTPAEAAPVIARCVAIKGAVVERDELDNGDRRFLNLGHTVGHAVEKLSGYTVPHGHAVAIGMVTIARAGERLGVTEAGTAQALETLLRKNALPTACPYDAKALTEAALGDKKRSGGEITVVMIEKIGRCFLKTLPVEELGGLIALGVE